jgi:hypothetical protein
MLMVNYARNRITAALEEIGRLMQSEFPAQHSRDAMNILRDKFEEQHSALERINDKVPLEIAKTQCNASLERLFVYVPILGFILRSTNVRNGFEAYGPLLYLAECLIGDETKLIVSSEWNFSPFTYHSITDLPGFVLIGLPATESSNPLIIPLAGHELGHSVWKSNRFTEKFTSSIRQGVLNKIKEKMWEEYEKLFPQYKQTDLEDDMFASLTWEPALRWSLLQVEEIFCDFLGVRLFAESYLYAFMYLLAPGTSGQRSLRYPNMKTRVTYLTKAAKELDVDVPTDFTSSFIRETEPSDPTTKFLVSIADTVSELCVSDLLEVVREFARNNNAPWRNSDRVNHIANHFKKWVVPTAQQEALVDILCAAWKCKLDEHLWAHVSQIEPNDWGRVLRDLTFKSMEVSEVRERLQKAARLRETS